MNRPRGGGRGGGRAAQQSENALSNRQQFDTIRGVLERSKDQLALALQKGMDPDRMIRFALTACSKTPLLYDCTRESVGLSLLNLGSLGLYPDGRNAHLVPFKDTDKGIVVCTPIIDYKGFAKLAHLHPSVEWVDAFAVRENDAFEYQKGTDPFVRWKVLHDDDKERGALKFAVAIVKIRDGGCQFRVMNRGEVLARKAVAKTTKVWDKWPDEMWAKTAFKALAKLAPLGDGVEAACELDNRIDVGDYGANLSGVPLSPKTPSSDAGGGAITGDSIGNAKPRPSLVDKIAEAIETADTADEIDNIIGGIGQHADANRLLERDASRLLALANARLDVISAPDATADDDSGDAAGEPEGEGGTIEGPTLSQVNGEAFESLFGELVGAAEDEHRIGDLLNASASAAQQGRITTAQHKANVAVCKARTQAISG
jgi:recombination protein RecT